LDSVRRAKSPKAGGPPTAATLRLLRSLKIGVCRRYRANTGEPQRVDGEVQARLLIKYRTFVLDHQGFPDNAATMDLGKSMLI